MKNRTTANSQFGQKFAASGNSRGFTITVWGVMFLLVLGVLCAFLLYVHSESSKALEHSRARQVALLKEREELAARKVQLEYHVADENFDRYVIEFARSKNFAFTDEWVYYIEN